MGTRRLIGILSTKRVLQGDDLEKYQEEAKGLKRMCLPPQEEAAGAPKSENIPIATVCLSSLLNNKKVSAVDLHTHQVHLSNSRRSFNFNCISFKCQLETISCVARTRFQSEDI